MNILIGFQKHDNEIDDIYLLPTLAISKYRSIKGKGYGIGIKFLKVIFMIGIIFRPIVQQPLHAIKTAHNRKRCTQS